MRWRTGGDVYLSSPYCLPRMGRGLTVPQPISDPLAEACAWAARLGGDDADWDGFTRWLEADPAHAAAYDRIAALDGEVTELAPAIDALLPANDAPVSRSWPVFAGLAAAAVAAAAVIVGPVWQAQSPAGSVYASTADAGRSVDLSNGITVRLDRASRVAVSADGKRIELATGAAYFDVDHRPDRPLTVAAGGYEVSDIGTRFDVARTGTGVAVAVAEGRVAVGRAGAEPSLTLAAGERLDLSTDSVPAVRSRIDPANVAAWRSGQLRYNAAPLSLVAADVSRYAGHRVVADPRLAGLTFSGAIEIGNGTGLVKRLQQLLPIDAQPDGDTIRLVPRGAG